MNKLIYLDDGNFKIKQIFDTVSSFQINDLNQYYIKRDFSSLVELKSENINNILQYNGFETYDRSKIENIKQLLKDLESEDDKIVVIIDIFLETDTQNDDLGSNYIFKKIMDILIRTPLDLNIIIQSGVADYSGDRWKNIAEMPQGTYDHVKSFYYQNLTGESDGDITEFENYLKKIMNNEVNI